MSLFNSKTETVAEDLELGMAFNLDIDAEKFIKYKGQSIYRRIFTGCLNRTKGLDDKQFTACLDNPSEDYNKNGLITLMSEAMQSKSKLEVVLDVASNGTNIIREADAKDKNAVKFDFASFSNTVDLVNFWLAFLYEIIKASYTGIKLSQAVIIKYADLRKSIANKETGFLKKMGTAIKDAIVNGKGAAVDAGDILETISFNFEPTKASMAAYYTLIANEVGLPISEITGEFTSGIGTTGEVDAEALDEAFRKWWTTPFKPILSEVFKNGTFKFKTNNWRKLKGYSDTLIAIENSGLISEEKKAELANELFE